MDTSSTEYDVVVIGGGPGGAKAARHLGEYGKKVALIEQHKVGGECLHYGCIPSKVLLYSAELYKKMGQMNQFGIDVPSFELNFEALMARREKVVNMLHRGLSATLKKAGVDIVHGTGRLTDLHNVEVTLQDESGEAGEAAEKQILQAKYIIIATGSAPVMIPGATAGQRILTNRTVFNITALPKSMLIVGGGSIGCEFASFFSTFGVETTVVELGPRLLAVEDEEIAGEYLRLIQKGGVKVLLESKVTSLTEKSDCIQATIECADGSTQEITADYSLVAAGRRYTYKDISAVDLGDKLNAYLQTQHDHIYMIGDVNGFGLLAYVAEKEGELAAKHICGEGAAMNYKGFSSAIFTHPEIAGVGLNEQQAKEQGIGYVVGKGLYAANAKALIRGERDGFAKVIVEKGTRRILGFHIIGSDATVLIDKAVLAVLEGVTIDEYSSALHGHPVLSEVLKDAVENAEKAMDHSWTLPE